MSDDILTEEIKVDMEDFDGKKRIKRLNDGSHPLDILGRILAEENEDYKASHMGAELYSWSLLEEARKGEADLVVLKLYKRNDAGDMEVYRKFCIVDNATGKPVPKPQKIANIREMNISRRDTVEHVGKIMDFEKTRAEANRRGVNIQAASSWRVLEQAKNKLEG